VAKRASSVLLTSGTLHPMHLLQTEFFAPSTWPVSGPASPTPKQERKAGGAQAAVADAAAAEIPEPPERLEFLQFSAPHFENVPNNLLNLFVSEAPSGTSGGGGVTLLGDYRSRSDRGYLSALGGCVLRAAGVVPKGLLVYFPSTAVLQACLQNWGLLPAVGNGAAAAAGSRGGRGSGGGGGYPQGSVAQQLAVRQTSMHRHSSLCTHTHTCTHIGGAPSIDHLMPAQHPFSALPPHFIN
jgi:hypothetical protein